MDGNGGHWDEGTINAWLDGELDASTAAALESHVAVCAECSERVAEARGLVASASRIVASLDDSSIAPSATPAVVPSAAANPFVAPRATSRTRRLFRVTPARSAIAATVLVALGVMVTRQRTGPDTLSEARREGILRDSGGVSTSPASAPAGLAITGRDSLLDSAIKRNLAQAQPPRVAKAAPGPAIPTPPAASPLSPPDSSADRRVATGREAVAALRDTMPAAAERATVGTSGRDNGVIVGMRAAAAPARPLGAIAPRIAVGPAGGAARAECYRVESAAGVSAAWGPVTLPFVAALDSGGQARLYGPDGTASDARALWKRLEGDSLDLTLRRIGYSGSLVLGSPGSTRAGVMRSAPSSTALSEVVVADVNAPPASPASAPGATQKRAGRSVPGAATAKSEAAATERAQQQATILPATPVVAHRVACP